MEVTKVKVFYNGQNAEHKYYAFEVAVLASATQEEYEGALREMTEWCKDNFPEPKKTGKRRPAPRFSHVDWLFIIQSETDATTFRLRWC
jgi:hypothetical protein